MNKAYKFRMYPTPQQLSKIEKTFDGVRFIFNKMLTDKLAYYNETGRQLKNTPAQYKTAFPWLREVDSLALANAQLNLQDAYTRFFRNPAAGFPKFKSKKHSRKAYTTNCVNGNIVIRDGAVKLPKIGLVKIKLHRTIPDSYKLKSVTVKCDFKGRYYACVLFEYKKRLANMKYKSNNRDKQHKKVLKIREKFYRQRDDFLHKQSRQIANAYDCVCIKDPAQGVSYDFGWALFKFFLKYKLLEKGKSLVMTDNIALSKMLYSFQAV